MVPRMHYAVSGTDIVHTHRYQANCFLAEEGKNDFVSWMKLLDDKADVPTPSMSYAGPTKSPVLTTYTGHHVCFSFLNTGLGP